CSWKEHEVPSRHDSATGGVRFGMLITRAALLRWTRPSTMRTPALPSRALLSGRCVTPYAKPPRPWNCVLHVKSGESTNPAGALHHEPCCFRVGNGPTRRPATPVTLLV